MILKKIKPAAQLQPYIDCYYLLEGEFTKPTNDVFFPDGCVEIVFHAGWDFYRNDSKEHWAKVIGQITKPLKIKVEGKGRSFGIWFYPHTFSLFSNVPLAELNDKAVQLENIFKADFIYFVGECLQENQTEKMIEEVELYLINILQAPKNDFKDRVANYAVRAILKHNGAIDLGDIALHCNVSSRYLQKIFLEKVGFSPRYYARILRFRQALAMLNTGSKINLTTVGYQTGYFDQPHFIREFKEFTGFSPSHYHIDNHAINKYFLTLPMLTN
jgi:AraC-like DNA-binding protein